MTNKLDDHPACTDAGSDVERIVPLTIWLDGAAYEKAKILADSMGTIIDPLSGLPDRVTTEETLAGLLEMLFEHVLNDA